MEYTSLSARIYKIQLDFLKKAAKVLGKSQEREVSIGDFVRLASLEYAEKLLGEKQPVCPPFTKGRKTAAAVVASALGMDRRAWERGIIEAATKHALSAMGETTNRKSDIGGLAPQIARRRSKTG
jgi:hypothetical protein